MYVARLPPWSCYRPRSPASSDPLLQLPTAVSQFFPPRISEGRPTRQPRSSQRRALKEMSSPPRRPNSPVVSGAARKRKTNVSRAAPPSNQLRRRARGPNAVGRRTAPVARPARRRNIRVGRNPAGAADWTASARSRRARIWVNGLANQRIRMTRRRSRRCATPVDLLAGPCHAPGLDGTGITCMSVSSRQAPVCNVVVFAGKPREDILESKGLPDWDARC